MKRADSRSSRVINRSIDNVWRKFRQLYRFSRVLSGPGCSLKSGARVTIYLGVAVSECGPADREGQSCTKSAHRGRRSDDPDLAQVAVDARLRLRGHGGRKRPGGTGAAGRRLLLGTAARRAHAGHGGLETLEAIRGSAYGSLPVVMLTADRGEAVVSRAVALGITDYLTKPISPKTTGERLGQVLHSLESDPGGQAGADDGQATIDGHVAVVVAEGDPVYRQFLMDFFTPRCATLLAPSGAEALAQCLRAAPRLVWAASTTQLPAALA